MKMVPWKVLAVMLLSGACSNQLRPDSGEVDDDSSDVDTSDTDDDTREPDTDTDTDTDFLNCRTDYITPAPGTTGVGGECTTDQVYCGDLLRATTVGGSTVYDTEEYNAAGIATNSEDWSAPERAYYLRQPQGQTMRITWWGPCADMDIAVCQGWECADPLEIQQNDCSALLTATGDGGFYRDFPAPGAGARDWEIVVDGRDGDVGNFAVLIECF